jgi:aminoglycoside phosphotransferase (APT) family kinase protein
MPFADRTVLARRIAGAAWAVGRDALAGGLPMEPEALTDPDAFARLVPSLGRPDAITREPHEAPSSNCRNSVLALDWGSRRADRPPTVFVKQPTPDLPTRLFANVIGFWWIECAVCRNLAAELPIPTPRIHAVHARGSRFLLVMENLSERAGARMFVNQALLDGVDLPTAERCLQTLARLHAGLAGKTPAEQERALPNALHPFRSPTLGRVNLAVNREAVAPCHARAPELFDEGAVALYRRALARWPALEAAWYRGPLTLCHGDSHLGNFFHDGSGAMGMLDFQGAHWGKGLRDVQYFLINSMDAELLAQHEKRLVEGYAEEVSQHQRHVAPLDAGQAWDQYRAFSFQTLMTAVVSRGLGSFTDSDAVMRIMLARAVAAVRRLEFGAWLDAL